MKSFLLFLVFLLSSCRSQELAEAVRQSQVEIVSVANGTITTRERAPQPDDQYLVWWTDIMGRRETVVDSYEDFLALAARLATRNIGASCQRIPNLKTVKS